MPSYTGLLSQYSSTIYKKHVTSVQLPTQLDDAPAELHACVMETRDVAGVITELIWQLDVTGT
jgi:hypothetical protein